MKEKKDGFLEDKIEPVAVVREHNSYVLSLIPYEETTTYIKGTAGAPEAVVEASSHMELIDESLGIDASKHGILTLRPTITSLKSISSHVRGVIADYPDAFHGFIGGEHSITPAIIEGLGEESLGIIWIDAHADLREAYGGRRDNHACAGFNSALFGPIVQVGVRTLAEEELEYLGKSDRVAAHRRWGEAAEKAIMALPQRVYLSVDADGLSPELVRSVGTPEPGGLSWGEMMEILEIVFKNKEVCAFDVVELCPQPSDVVSNFTIAKLIYKILSYHALHKIEKRAPRPVL
ncbi:MAG: hypothetical protein GTO51_10650 [Candidatus Latescibacteria bacterium]|nr:hypothetical protein [Candidatus Latescibacterota bacterium]NIM66425.1 hypothetical protein [Candidatus Latescibacterota bacterium]NIO02905.1 hypothetical protein [Candidatus Latescibacterota bacterium]NIO30040.1 hypothetical protein [Candidatus Latescibacterota bacterium]NIO57655.1 hypothetical protein [Candidatus Latescibacterota bacterium]